ncbi:hypothetical protein EIP91_002995 [Steccherinum ochraceum]|uniref:F-box domain-containing protein n=1 Tax=Steccherinum ochraceum TaxID=92696 RepID=A0A4R0RJN6_9APHY|nr:hypothetical protein EIP91_002995 [Steccherinum ochraceum]
MQHLDFDFLTYLNQVHTATDLYDTDIGVIPPVFQARPLTPDDIIHLHHPHSPSNGRPGYLTSPIRFPQNTFPTNLLSHIFSYLDPTDDDDADTFAACAQTCKQWTIPAERRLYQSIVAHDERSLFLLWDKLDGSADLSQHVREIKLKDSNRTGRVANFALHPRSERLPSWFLASPATLAPLAHNTSVLKIENINWRAFWLRNDLATTQWLSQWLLFPPLQELSLTSCSFTSFSEFELVMTAFSRIRKLSMEYVSWGEHPIAMAEALRAVSRRQSIALNGIHVGFGCDIHTITMWLLGTSSMSTLESIEFDAGHEASPEILAPFLSQTRRTTRYLRIGCAGMMHSLGPTLSIHISFHAWPLLRTFHLTLLGLAPERVNWVPICLARALPDIPRPSSLCPTKLCMPAVACATCRTQFCAIKTIVFDIWLSDPSELENPVWDHITLILHRLVAGGRGVERIVFAQRGALSLLETDYVVKRRLGSLHPFVETRSEWVQ